MMAIPGYGVLPDASPLLAVLLPIAAALAAAFVGVPLLLWIAGAVLFGWLCGAPLWLGIVAAPILAILGIPPLRCRVLSAPILSFLQRAKILPAISDT